MQGEYPLISVIVPVYNVERYLEECLESILRQSYPNFELLLIDDGSLDSSGLMCDQYAAKDERIKVFHQTNAKQGAARNKGLDNASGEFITMVDADDALLSDDCLMILYEVITEYQASCSMCDVMAFGGASPPEDVPVRSNSIQIVKGRVLYTRNDFLNRGYLRNAVYAKLFRKECFEQIRFPEGCYMEDIATMHKVIFPLQAIAVYGSDLYGYRKRADSTMRSVRKSRIVMDHVKAVNGRADFFEAFGETKLAEQARNSISMIYASSYWDALVDGSLNEIPSELRPDIYDYERAESRLMVRGRLLLLEKGQFDDIKNDYLRTEWRRIMMVIGLSREALFGQKEQPPFLDLLVDISGVIRMAKDEGLEMPVRMAILGHPDAPEELKDACSIIVGNRLHAYASDRKFTDSVLDSKIKHVLMGRRAHAHSAVGTELNSSVAGEFIRLLKAFQDSRSNPSCRLLSEIIEISCLLYDEPEVVSSQIVSDQMKMQGLTDTDKFIRPLAQKLIDGELAETSFTQSEKNFLLAITAG